MCCTEKKRKNHECQVCSGTTCVWVGTAMFGMHVCDMEGEKGLRWIRIIKAAIDVSKARLLLVAMGPPYRHAPSTSSGFPPILCNLTAVIPIMPQLRTLYPCHYPQLLSVDQGDTAVPVQTPLLAQISGKPNIFPHSIYSAKSEKSFKGIKWKHLALVLTWLYPRSSVRGAHFHWLDGILLWCSESQYLLWGGGKQDKCWFWTVNGA